jgi:hypothetical protein
VDWGSLLEAELVAGPRVSLRTALSRAARGAAETARRLRRSITRRRILWTIAIAAGVIVLAPALFIATQCYGNGTQSPVPPPRAADQLPAFARSESFTYLTLPEWFIVYSADEYARFVERGRPSGFPYFRSIAQYWKYYGTVCGVTSREYAFEGGYQMMLGVIGASFTVEYLVKGLYENTVGRVFEWVSSSDTPEDAFAARTAREYGAFMHTVPWYQFPFGSKLAGLWRDTPFWGRYFLRKMERKFALSAEYGVKAVYGWLMGLAVGAAYAPEDLQILAWVSHAPPAIFDDARVQKVLALDPGSYVVRLPRYEAFTEVMLALIGRGASFDRIAGNDEILLTAIAPAPIAAPLPDGHLLAAVPVLTERPKVRLLVRAPVAALHRLIPFLRGQGAVIEHLYDY